MGPVYSVISHATIAVGLPRIASVARRGPIFREIHVCSAIPPASTAKHYWSAMPVCLPSAWPVRSASPVALIATTARPLPAIPARQDMISNQIAVVVWEGSTGTSIDLHVYFAEWGVRSATTLSAWPAGVIMSLGMAVAFRQGRVGAVGGTKRRMITASYAPKSF